jgi:hypothetical protein
VNLVGLLVYLLVAGATFRPGGSPVGLAVAYGVGYNAILVPSYWLLWRERLISGRPLLLAIGRSAVVAPLVFIPTWLTLRGLALLSVPTLPTLLIGGLIGAASSLLAVSLIDGEVREHVLEALRKQPAEQLEARMGDA